MRDEIKDEYFEWLFKLVCTNRFMKRTSFRKLLIHLYDTEFRWVIPKDQNRAHDGLDLRRRFILIQGYEDSYDLVMSALDGPCSILEMMIALAIRCEEDVMDDPHLGDRTAQWFWGMITNLGLGSMIDEWYEEEAVDDILERFLDREYEPNGRGGLFTVRHCDQDLRTVEIWYQLCWYLDTITDTDI